jgi:hypothetical protein
MSYIKNILQGNLFGDNALQTLRGMWRDTIEGEGGRCPCCDRWGKINALSISETLALSLLWLSRQPVDDDGFVNVPACAPAWVLRTKTYSTLQHWGLIIKVDRNEDKTKRSDGFWQVTSKGLAFLKGEISVPKKVFIYDNTIQGFSQEEIYFRNCFGKHFDYQQVMSDSFNLNNIKA